MPAAGPSRTGAVPTKRYRLPGIEHEGIAQLSLLETALWPLQGGKLPMATYQTSYPFTVDKQAAASECARFCAAGT